MMENYALVAALGPAGPRPRASARKAKREKAPRAWDHQYSRANFPLLPAPGKAAPSQAPVAFQDVAVYLTTEEWAGLKDWQRELYQDVMKENYQLVSSVGAGPRGPEEEPAGLDPSEMPAGRDAARVSPGAAGPGASASRRQRKGRPAGKGHDEPPGVPLGGTEPQSKGTPECQRGRAGPGAVPPSSEGQCMAQHQRQPAGAGAVPCSQCGKAFSSQGCLRRHRAVHSGEKPFACGQCGRGFTRQEHLVRHEETHVHKEPRPCPECSKTFLHEGSLLLHHRAHAGARPFGCPHCCQSFPDRGALRRHQWAYAGGLLPPGSGTGGTFSEFLQIHEMLVSGTHTHVPLGALTKYK
ncbi:uncharacterized protein LOC142823891 isoform X3 [Pelodiscus sinensis]|uniref:uncharacterized protein LOC142823891 isoform X3 n=1 Tax=Pelodiscus sinensis TaxID=13735 RepID=UPI003F6D982E